MANVLLDDKGNVRISDMGLTADISGGPIKHKAGSPGYWAPEQVKGEPYTTAPDWWSLGVTIYALATDKKLFHSEEETCNKMVKDHDWTKSPCITSDALKDCLQQLCLPSQTDRINNLDKLKAHAWFAGFSWSAVIDGTIDTVQAYRAGEPVNCVNLDPVPVRAATLTVRHHDRVGVLASVLQILRKEELNVSNMQNRVFAGSKAAVASIDVGHLPSAEIVDEVQALEDVIYISVTPA